MAATLSFFSSLRRGLGAAITRADDPAGGGAEARAQVVARIEFGSDHAAAINLPLVGPGDIIGLDPRTIVRTYPRRDDNDAESGYFAMVELDQPDLPWRYTAARPAGDRGQGNDTLRPWLTLIVLEEGGELEEEHLQPASLSRKLPLVSAPLSALPDLSEAWAWAHVQAHERIETPDALEKNLERARERLVARLLSPRILLPGKRYRAFLVPTFLRGRLVGTTGAVGEQVDALTPAWDKAGGAAGTDERVTLPYYFDWRFQTGSAGSFEALVDALTPAVFPASVGRRTMDVRAPGLGLSAPAAETLSLSGALRSLEAAKETDAPVASAFITALKRFVDVSEVTVVEGGVTRKVKVVAPPLYGRWYAGRSALDAPTQTPPRDLPWFQALNSDPRQRVPAALGTAVVQNEQEALLASAWQQIDNLRTINYERKVLQTGRAALGRVMGRHVRTGYLGSQLSLTGRLHGRVLVGDDETVFTRLDSSAIGRAFLDPIWRRLSSPRGLLGRRMGLPAQTQDPQLFERLNEGKVVLDPTPPAPTANDPEKVWAPAVPGGLSGEQVKSLFDRLGRDGALFWGLALFWVSRELLVRKQGNYFWLLHRLMRLGLSLARLASTGGQATAAAADKLKQGGATAADATGAPPAGGFVTPGPVILSDPTTWPTPTGTPVPGAPDSEDARLLREALAELLGHRRRKRIVSRPYRRVDLRALLDACLGALDPDRTLVEAHAARVTLRDPWRAEDPLEPIQAAPVFEQPMVEPLRALGNEWILPGLGQVEPNTIGLLETNQRFVESYMVGVNHEMTRELLWHEYPIDQRGTYFRQFWDPRGHLSTPGHERSAEELRDIDPVHAWPATARLGANSSRPAGPDGERLVLLVRGELVKRYPNVIVYAATHPVRGEVPPAGYEEVHPIFQGFLGADAVYYGFDLARSDARSRFYFILQEQPAEPRFAVPIEIPTAGLANATAALLRGPRNPGEEPAPPPRSAAEVADVTFRNPVRVAVHGSAMVPPP